MHFTVERRLYSAWKLVEAAIEAVGPSQAVARAASDAGIYRAADRHHRA